VPGHGARAGAVDRAGENRAEGLKLLRAHPVFAPLAGRVRWHSGRKDNWCPPSGWAVVTSTGTVHLHPDRYGTPAEWAWVAAHSLIHLGFGHVGWRKDSDRAWNLACCLTVNRFAVHVGVGLPPNGIAVATPYDQVAETTRGEESLADRLRGLGTELDLHTSGTGGHDGDLRWANAVEPAVGSSGGAGLGKRQAMPLTAADPQAEWAELLAAGLAYVAGRAVDGIGGVDRTAKTRWRQALDWFIAHYPLLGAIADAFTLVEDADVCRAHGIRIAAISPAAAELYVNPLDGLTGGERRFIIAHELLHAGLRHDTRTDWRDPFLWNVACDYVINGWLAEMGVGDLPDSALHDAALRGLSAEEIYDRIVTDRRRLRKIATLRGVGLADVLPHRLPRDSTGPVRGVDLDEFYRRSLTDGLAAYQARGRGTIPAVLIQEIRALAHPPVPWDVELARWFDHRFPPLERRRSYARASRRQTATPDIPRAGWHRPADPAEQRTFGVVLDTSGSMDTRLLAKALGAIASYAVARDVLSVRVIFCDAEAHDNGWMHPTDVAGRVRVRGRGGTVLQPGVATLQEAPDFPKNGPILIITDAACDRVRVQRDHAFLIPAGAVLPFPPRGPVFRFS
jgi:predicted metal-dependent peptidase